MPMSASDRRALMILGGVVVVAILVWFIFLRPKGDGDTAAVGETPTAATVVSPGASPGVSPGQVTPTPSLPRPPAATVQPALSGYDIFSPLPVLSPSLSPGASPAATPSPTAGDTTTVGGKEVKLLDMTTKGSSPAVKVSVAGQDYTVKSGNAFDGGFSVIEITDPCAKFHYEKGSATEDFELCLPA